jgi:protein involved in polysaccharide export with SLBB domain
MIINRKKAKMAKSICIIGLILLLNINGITKATFSYPLQNFKPVFIPGDGVSISTFPDTSSFLNNVFPIDDKGYIEFPIEGKVNVAQMSIAQLEDYLKNTFKAWLRNPNIYVKPVIRVSLSGGFVRPGLYYVDPGISLWDLVRTAGGPVLEGGIYEMKWERNGKEQTSDLVQYFEAGVSLRQIGFKSGDQIRTTAPTTETFWDQVNNFLPLITISTTIFIAYITYQQTAIQAR